MGLWDQDLGFRLPDKLPPLPRRPQALRPSRPTRSATARPADRAHELVGWPNRSTSPRRRVLVTLLDVAGIDRRTRDPKAHRSRAGFDVSPDPDV